ncbi:LysR family transcriptional regulator [Gallaecimonas mangrovi]|uniref:LysR family transcriptional regulator n=1 Tax=Gallaecimonas mangrovi TaxID=2291597 RepID=UPI000E1FB9F6|nr:LysR family transcriptional regulator [Gallaecimonas mangrovi]
MTVNTKAMQLYVATLELGNFSEVARREGVSPSSVSRIVQQLETELGTQLLYRNTRAVEATEAGKLYAQAFRQMLATLDETQQRLLEREAEPGGLVRINAPVAFGNKHIVPWLPALYRRYPALQVELVQTDDFINPMTDAADLLFRIGPLQDSGLHMRLIDRPQYSFAASTDYLSRYAAPQTPEQLYNHNCLVYKGKMGLQKAYFSRPGQPVEMHSFSGSLRSNNADTLVQAALDGLGIVMMPDWQIGSYINQGHLIPLLTDHHIAPLQQQQVIAMLYPKTRYLPAAIRAVIDFFAEKYGEPPYWKFAGQTLMSGDLASR